MSEPFTPGVHIWKVDLSDGALRLDKAPENLATRNPPPLFISLAVVDTFLFLRDQSVSQIVSDFLNLFNKERPQFFCLPQPWCEGVVDPWLNHLLVWENNDTVRLFVNWMTGVWLTLDVMENGNKKVRECYNVGWQPLSIDSGNVRHYILSSCIVGPNHTICMVPVSTGKYDPKRIEIPRDDSFFHLIRSKIANETITPDDLPVIGNMTANQLDSQLKEAARQQNMEFFRQLQKQAMNTEDSLWNTLLSRLQYPRESHDPKN